ncbi:hypothetical protein M6B38_157730 [Iris pallida]|uniref:Uncharacterized protein n=1 Tax=Iris pallida TaxID=29817 RepID=A0AAX6F1D2_IRIPA|nr:hypothetical protein M6B38_157730 [Iris pallida]
MEVADRQEMSGQRLDTTSGGRHISVSMLGLGSCGGGCRPWSHAGSGGVSGERLHHDETAPSSRAADSGDLAILSPALEAIWEARSSRTGDEAVDVGGTGEGRAGSRSRRQACSDGRTRGGTRSTAQPRTTGAETAKRVGARGSQRRDCSVRRAPGADGSQRPTSGYGGETGRTTAVG